MDTKLESGNEVELVRPVPPFAAGTRMIVGSSYEEPPGTHVVSLWLKSVFENPKKGVIGVAGETGVMDVDPAACRFISRRRT